MIYLLFVLPFLSRSDSLFAISVCWLTCTRHDRYDSSHNQKNTSTCTKDSSHISTCFRQCSQRNIFSWHFNRRERNIRFIYDQGIILWCHWRRPRRVTTTASIIRSVRVIRFCLFTFWYCCKIIDPTGPFRILKRHGEQKWCHMDPTFCIICLDK